MDNPKIVVHSSSSGCTSGLSVNSLPSFDLVSNRRISQSSSPSIFLNVNSNENQLVNQMTLEKIEEELLLQEAINPFLINCSDDQSLLFCGSHITNRKHQIQILEYLFDILQVPKLYMASESQCLFSFIKNSPMHLVSCTSAKQQRVNDFSHTKLITTSFSDFSGFLVYSDFSEMRIRLLLSGYEIPQNTIYLPYGDHTLLSILNSYLHKPFRLNKKLESVDVNQCIHSSNNNTRHECCWKLARFLLERQCFVSLDTEIDSWLLSRNKIENMTENLTDSSSNRDYIEPPYLIDSKLNTESFKKMKLSINQPDNPLDKLSKCLSLYNVCTPVTSAISLHDSVDFSHAETNLSCCIRNHSASLVRKRSFQIKKGSRSDDKLYDFFHDRILDPLLTMDMSQWNFYLSNHHNFESTIQQCLKEYLFLPTEIFFQPKSILSSLLSESYLFKSDLEQLLKNWKPVSVNEALVNIFDSTPIDLRKQIYSNIVILGSAGAIPFFPNRLVKETQEGLYHRFKKNSKKTNLTTNLINKINVESWIPSNATVSRYAVWIGGKYLASDDSINNHFVSKDEVLEMGYSNIATKFSHLI